MKELTLQATLENLTQVTDFLEQELESAGCPMKAQIAISIAAEEIYVNIAHYAYAPETGEATVRIEIRDDPTAACISFIDSGVAFDPLAKADPDVTLSGEERGIGGLGIYMTKKSMDDVRYARTDGKNVLTIVKNFEPAAG